MMLVKPIRRMFLVMLSLGIAMIISAGMKSAPSKHAQNQVAENYR